MRQVRGSDGISGTAYSNTFDYDGMGNRTRLENVSGGNTRVTSSTPNELNQLTALYSSVNGEPAQTSGFAYDESGNTTRIENADGGKTLFTYDDADRLVRIERKTAADVPLGKSEFIYDYASRKAVSREFTWTNNDWSQTDEKRRVFDGLDVVQERNDQNQVTAQLVRDGNIGGILARSNAVGATFFGYDGGGNVTLLTDENGDDVGRYRYDAFGNTLEAVGPRAAENPYRFSTKELHAASGLYDFGFRFYSPGLGRWINRDPLSEDGGVNLYAALGNSPTNAVDEYGELPRPLGGPLLMSNGSEAMGGAGGIRSPGVPRIPFENMGGSGGSRSPSSDFDRMMAKRMEGVNPWADGSAPIGSPMYGMGAVRVPPRVGTKPPNLSPPGSNRRGAFGEAKRRNGIPRTQQPDRVLPNTDKRGDPQPGKIYEFNQPNGPPKRLRDDAGGHYFGPGNSQNRGPHFNDDAGNHYDYCP